MHLLTCGLGAVVCAASVAVAQQSFDATEYTARSIARTALVDLRLTPAPGDADYRVASQLLSLAHDLQPKDTEVLRRWIQAAYACADGPLVLELTRKLLAEDPSDTVARLRQITSSIALHNQTAEARLAAYERFLDPKGPGRQIDPSVLSRLALDAALLLRERGDDEGFIRKLIQSTQLDSSHKEAAQLAAAVYSERQPGNRRGRLEMLENLLMADPVDPHVHLSISHELGAVGAFTGARRFLENAGRIGAVVGLPPEGYLIESFVLDWREKGARHLVETMNKELANARAKTERDAASMRENGVPEASIPKASEVRLNPQARIVYTLALEALGEKEALATAVAELSVDSARQIANIRDEMNKQPEKGEELARMGVEVVSQITMIRLWTNTEVAGAESDLPANSVIDLTSPDMAAVLRGWLSLRKGEHAAAREMLAPHAEVFPFAAVGLALCDELDGNTAAAIEAYRALVHSHPANAIGAYASVRGSALGMKDDPKLVEALEALARGIPASIDLMSIRPDLAQRIEVKLAALRPEAIERHTATITIQNMSDFPLAVGPDRPISSRFLLSPKIETAAALAAGMVQPEVIDLDRRLRLKPREKMDISVWTDAGQSGWLMEALANRSMRVRWRLTQGFQVDARGGFRPGVMSLTTETQSQVRTPIPEASIPTGDLAARIATEPGAVMSRLAAAVRAAILQPLFAPGGAGGAASLPESVAVAFAARYPKLPAQDRAMLAAVLPHAGLAPVMAAVDQVMRAETEALPLCVVLATRVAKADDELLIKCLESDDPRVKAMAESLSEKLSVPIRTYSRMTASVVSAPLPGAAPEPQK